MAFLIDLHVHTNRYSSCSIGAPAEVVRQAARAGLDGIVITEHHRQWCEEELELLRRETRDDAEELLTLAAVEYTTACGDILIYGLDASRACALVPGQPPAEVIEFCHALGAACVAAHPTRAGMGFDGRVRGLGLAAVEVYSMNLKEHEQRMALALARDTGLPSVAGSDAHRPEHVGAYATEFDAPIRSMADLAAALREGTRFRPALNSASEAVIQ